MKIFVMLLLMLCIPFVLSACGASDTPDVPDILIPPAHPKMLLLIPL